MKKTYLVTGAGGFIGTALCAHLDSQKIPVVKIGRGDFNRLKKILQAREPQVIFHLAGGRGNFLKMVEDNIISTLELFETILSIRGFHPRVIVVGSAAEYGARPVRSLPIRENSQTKPLLLYGWVKLIETKAALHYARQGIDVVVARLFNIMGPAIPVWAAAGNFAKEIIPREKSGSQNSLAFGDLSGARDFLDIRDIALALLVLSQKGKSGQIYNICSQEKVVMRDLLSQMIAASAKPSLIYKEDRTQKPGVLYAVGSSAKFKKISQWSPQYSLQQSIQDTLAYYRQQP